jgi:hypothetical protein
MVTLSQQETQHLMVLNALELGELNVRRGPRKL